MKEIGTAEVLEALEACLLREEKCERCAFYGPKECLQEMARAAIDVIREYEKSEDLITMLQLVQRGIVTSYQGDGFRIERSE